MQAPAAGTGKGALQVFKKELIIQKIIITGSSGFYGSIFNEHVSMDDNVQILGIDRLPHLANFANTTYEQLDLRDYARLKSVIADNMPIDAVFHIATVLAHEVKSKKDLWQSNVDGTKNLVNICRELNIKKFSFLSSNCAVGKPADNPLSVSEEVDVKPLEIYGQSKLVAEKIVLDAGFDGLVVRCPTIIKAGRLGLLTILFEFVRENKIVWMMGKGGNRYQFIYADDLSTALVKSLEVSGGHLVNIGAENVPTFRELFENLIEHAHSTSRIVHLPEWPVKFALQLAHYAKISPLGPYHYNMLSEDFVFNIDKIKRLLSWHPSKSNVEMMCEAYDFWEQNREELYRRNNVSPHNSPAKTGILKLIKYFS